MGIKDLMKVKIGPNQTIADLVDINNDFSVIAGKKLAIDGLYMVHRNTHAIKAGLTGGDQQTQHILVTVNMISQLNRNNIGQIWVFDTKTDDLKRECVERRGIKLKNNEVADIKKLLKLRGITYIETDVEAEFYCAELQKNGIVDYIYTNDTDTLLRGGTIVYTRKVGNKSQLHIVDGMNIIKQLNITIEQFCKIGVILGCDFAPKTPKIGPSTVLAKYQYIKLTEQQQLGYDKLLSVVDLKKNKTYIEQPNANINELVEWLTQLQFSEKTIKKLDV